MRTYYIVKHVDEHDRISYMAHKRGFLSTFNIFNNYNVVRDSWIGSSVFNASAECEGVLRRILNPVKPKVIKIVRI